MKREKNSKKYSETTPAQIEEDFTGLEFFPIGSRNCNGELINMATGMSKEMAGAVMTQKSATPMQDLVYALDNREKELDAYLRSLADDQRNLMTRLEEIKHQQQVSENDLLRVQRAKAILRDDEEPIRYDGGQKPTVSGVRFTGRDTAYGSDIRRSATQNPTNTTQFAGQRLKTLLTQHNSQVSDSKPY